MQSEPALSLSFNNLTELPVYAAAARVAGLPTPLPFVEVLWDNFAHMDPYELRDLLQRHGREISVHVMWSRFMTRPVSELDDALALLASHVRVLRPARVADHPAAFKRGERWLPHATELQISAADAQGFAQICERVERYQSRIGQTLLLENSALEEPGAASQLEALDALRRRTGCGLLFDVSNAVVSHLNGVEPVSRWVEHLRGATLDCHIGGFRHVEALGRHVDTHSRPLGAESVALLRELCTEAHVRTVCFEREFRVDQASVAADLRVLRRALGVGRFDDSALPRHARTDGAGPSQLERAMELSRRELYLADAEPVIAHARWQSPFALGLGADSPHERAARIGRALELWLRGTLTSARQIWVTDHASGVSYAARRAVAPGGRHDRVGPLPIVLVESGAALHRYPITFLESDQPFDAMWSELEALRSPREVTVVPRTRAV